MTRQQLEHVIRAAGSVTDEKTIPVLGSQSILGSVENPPELLVRSMEADVYPLKAPEKMDLINGAIGEITHFQETFGYYAHGIPPEACPLPAGWEKRLEPLKNDNTGGVVGLCLSVPDLACSKLAAGREKDLEFVGELLRHRVITANQVGELIVHLPRHEHQMNALRTFHILTERQRVLEQQQRGWGPDRSTAPEIPFQQRERQRELGEDLSL